MKMRFNKQNVRKANKGITLIALIVTIIVLLILAGVSIAVSKGENGILEQAKSAKTVTEEEDEKEKIELEVLKSYKKNGNLDVTKLKRNIENNLDDVDEVTLSDSENKFPVTVKYENGNEYTIKNNGDVKKALPTITAGQTAPSNSNAIYEDGDYTVIVPAGFTVSDKTGESSVETGVVIKDGGNNEFVWIPVGIAKKSGSGTIELGRYDFNSNGTPSAYSGSNAEEDSTNTSALLNYGNTIAKNINDFIEKTNEAGGFYIGRYEARTTSSTTARSDKTDPLTAVTENASNMIYNYITQPDAATKARTMYATNNYFECDLVNSYAWDTATLFLQEYDDRAIKPKVYSIQNSIVFEINEKGTNNPKDSSKVDKICNVYDMASNCYEFSTETNSDSDKSVIHRGGFCYVSDFHTCTRGTFNTTACDDYVSFRPILYVK